MTFSIAERLIGPNEPTYFIADIAASHDGNLDRAVELIYLVAKAGADAAKFQNFTATEIVSDRGFRELGAQIGHQARWEKPVTEVYAEASIPHDWTPTLKRACDDAGIHYFSSAYDFAAIDMLAPYVPAYKIGSGDITWLEAIEYTAAKNKPMLLATGASEIDEVIAAVHAVRKYTDNLVLMQCNTNYTGSHDNLDHIHLNVLKAYSVLFPGVVLGLSDHSPGHSSVLGAIALGARVVEKHFTDDTSRPGPDHGFSMDAVTWRDMVDRARELEAAMGSPLKGVAQNETETVIVQRRALRARTALPAGHLITRDDLTVLRPAPADGFGADELQLVVGAVTRFPLEVAQLVRRGDIVWNN
ncbi:N-acetylneuraminate synthase family protein [Pengzhenrongella sp.]|jgi:N-acetylneuraminate synthase|uniref:N-acetylneuraminate synthase family protein n=1 Tax=Pengzhenrongella sp. TaxID=2888820 RepID=UPI002F93699F